MQSSAKNIICYQKRKAFSIKSVMMDGRSNHVIIHIHLKLSRFYHETLHRDTTSLDKLPPHVTVHACHTLIHPYPVTSCDSSVKECTRIMKLKYSAF